MLKYPMVSQSPESINVIRLPIRTIPEEGRPRAVDLVYFHNGARRLLREDRLTVTCTAEVCGYANPYVFSKVFKEVTGVSPGKV